MFGDEDGVFFVAVKQLAVGPEVYDAAGEHVGAPADDDAVCCGCLEVGAAEQGGFDRADGSLSVGSEGEEE